MIVCAIVFAAVGAIYFTHRPRPLAAPVSKPMQAAAVPKVVTLSGTVRAQHTVPVGVMVNGQVESFMADVGQEVYEGQLLAHIGNPGLDGAQENARKLLETAQGKVNSLEAAIIAGRLEASRARTDAARAKDQLDRNEKAYKRQQMLNAQGATPRLAFEKAEREYESSQGEAKSLEALAQQAESRLEAAMQQLEPAKRVLAEKQQQVEGAQSGLAAADVHAPVSGLVIARKGEIGRQISSEEGKDLFRIAVDLSMLEAVVDVDARAAAQLNPGQAVQVVVPEMRVDAIPATIREVRAGQAIAEFISPTPALRPGASCAVRVQLK